MAEVQWTGQFYGVNIPLVDIGDQVRAYFGYYGYNRDAIRWKTILIALCPAVPSMIMMLDITNEWGESANREYRSYWLADSGSYEDRLFMPDHEVAITFYLMAHDDAGYWYEHTDFWQYYYGYSWPPYFNGSNGLRPLVSTIVYLSPQVPSGVNPPAVPESQLAYIQDVEGNVTEEERPVSPPRQTSALPWLLMIGGAGMILLTAGGKPKPNLGKGGKP